MNRDRFLFHDNGGEWKQFVEKGDAVLFYEYTDSRTLLYDNIKRTYYRNDNWTGDNVRYEEYMTQFSGLLNIAAELRYGGPVEKEQVAIPLNDMQAAELLDNLGIDPASIGPNP